MGSKSKRLGKGFEYEVRDLLREATGIQSFERVPTSGAWIGGQNAYKAQFGREDVTEIMSGDIICPQGWRWTVECKNEADVPIHQLFLGDKCDKINEYLEQVFNSSMTAKKQPLLIMKYRKSGYKLPKRIVEILDEANVSAPKTNSVTLGIIVAEEVSNSYDISDLNHIYYTAVFSNNTKTSWRFFDIENWFKHINERQFLNQAD